jgi:hypothetical protein
MNALECDMIRAKASIAALIGGSTPEYVRAPEGVTNETVLITYASTLVDLDHKLWDVDSTDSTTGDTVAKVTAALGAGIGARLLLEDRDLVVLFHDRIGLTANNLDVYLLAIAAAVVAGGFVPQFALL